MCSVPDNYFLNNENDSIPPRSQRQRGEFFHSRCRYSGGMSSLHMDWTALRKLFFSKKWGRWWWELDYIHSHSRLLCISFVFVPIKSSVKPGALLLLTPTSYPVNYPEQRWVSQSLFWFSLCFMLWPIGIVAGETVALKMYDILPTLPTLSTWPTLPSRI